MICQRGSKADGQRNPGFLTSSQERTLGVIIDLISSCHVETVCCLYHQKKDFISVPYELRNADYLQQLK